MQPREAVEVYEKHARQQVRDEPARGNLLFLLQRCTFGSQFLELKAPLAINCNANLTIYCVSMDASFICLSWQQAPVMNMNMVYSCEENPYYIVHMNGQTIIIDLITKLAPALFIEIGHKFIRFASPLI